MALEDVAQRAAGRVPELDCLVIRGRRQQSSVH